MDGSLPNYRISNGVLDDYVNVWIAKEDSHSVYNLLVRSHPNIFQLKDSSWIKQQATPCKENLRKPIPFYGDYVTRNYDPNLIDQILQDSYPRIIRRLDIVACKYNAVIELLVIHLALFEKLPERENTFLQKTARDTVALIKGELTLSEYTKRSISTLDEYLGTETTTGQTLTNSSAPN